MTCWLRSHDDRIAVLFADVDDVIRRFDAQDYLLDVGTASAIYLAVTLGRPLLLEGEPGVGKTTAAKTLATVLGTPLLRLQCYEGLTAAEALYDWNYQRQLLSIRLAEARGAGIDESDLYTEAYLVDRPILQCVRYRGPERAGAADRRDRPCRRRIRGAAAGVPRRGGGHRPGTGHLRRRAPTDRGADVQPQPRSARRAAAALPLPLDRLPGAVRRGRDRAPHRARCDAPLSSSTPPSSSAVQEISTSTSHPAWPRRSTGWPPWLRSGVTDLVSADTERALAGIGALAKTPDDHAAISDAFAQYSSH